MTLENFIQSNKIVNLKDIDKALAISIQTKLKQGKFYNGTIDGIVGSATMSAFAKFKASVWLERPEELGKTTALALLEIGENSNVTDDAKPLPVNPKAGSKTGTSMRLPGNRVVYANELVTAGIPITWGEWTKDCKRIPDNAQIVNNIIATTKIFGIVRDKYGSPLTITSGYRPSAINRAIGGASRSQHIHGRALDITCSDLSKLYKICKDTPQITGLGSGMHKGFVHVDIRSGDRVYFSYP